LVLLNYTLTSARGAIVNYNEGLEELIDELMQEPCDHKACDKCRELQGEERVG
jgi:uncharacterized protein YegL